MWVAPALLLYCFGLARGAERGEGRVVSTTQGAVRGYPSARGEFYAFYGIPYATAPTGRDKFKAPLPAPSWNNVLEATNDNITCPQTSHPMFMNIEFNEDCLIANVFVPNDALETKKKLPVMVYVHGGGFAIGSGNMETHETLIHQDIVVVNFNYRLGAYGFLCLGTKDIPGNAGMKDQVAALKWVQQNIANFGGNPDDVTIGGSSAGSASVELLMLSPMTKGLFTKVISESGSALSVWAVDPDPVATAKRFVGDISDKRFDDVMEIEDYFKSLTMEQLISKLYFSEPDSSSGFSPCLEQMIEEEESFLNEAPLEILKSGKYNKVPYMTGFSSEEGLIRIDLFDDWKVKMETNFADFLPRDLTFPDEAEKKSVAEKVKRFYFKDRPVNIDTLKEYVNYFTDVTFGYSTIKSAMLHVTNSVPVYLYQYSYVSEEYPIMPHAHSDKIKGAHHCAQSMAVHKVNFIHHEDDENDVLMQNRLSKMWADFIKFGIPVKSTSDLLPVSWDTMDANTINYLSMDLKLERKERLLGDRLKFWDAIYRDYYRTPLSPDMPRLHTEL